ncbi:hypothetical protein U737_09655 [Methylomonas sp. LW13]|uniref:hypothetical protein n=1 Tax=unclassified Methylomonas TaxID=2608980 RepID=UPI00051C6862|nr:hypothetical protein [Methylomonas sp. LW13]QBC27145.1 hypothetical protein U737_09655 [Methylomonas sp. LW13]
MKSQQVTPATSVSQTTKESDPTKSAIDPHADKRRWWRLSDRDFKIIVGSFQPVKNCYQEAIDAERRGELTEEILNALCDSAYHFDRIAHLVFQFNLGFDQEMTHFRTDLPQVCITDLADSFDALSGHVDLLIEHQPTGKATPHSLEKLHQLSGVMACGALHCIDDFYPKDWIPDGNMAETPAVSDHRLSPLGGVDSAMALADTVNMMTNKALSVVSMLGNAVAGDDDQIRPSDDDMYYALRSVGDELTDIKAVVSAFHQATKSQHA